MILRNLCSLFYKNDSSLHLVLLPRWPCYRGGPVTEVVLLPRWSCYRGGPVTKVILLPRWSCYRGGPVTKDEQSMALLAGEGAFLRWSQ